MTAEIEVICQVCGDAFLARYSTAKYCSGACRQRRWRQRHSYVSVDVPVAAAEILRRSRPRRAG